MAPHRKDVCKNGHPRVPENLRPNRSCRLCAREIYRRYNDKKPKRRCEHKNFEAHVDVNRIEDIGRFTADVRIKCAECNLPFEFVGVDECGLSYAHPTVNPSAQELRVPIKPKGCEILPGIKGPTGFKVERAN
jgi:hypothetical protein